MSANHLRTLTPAARNALCLDDYLGLNARAVALGAHVFAVGRTPEGPWTVHASNHAIVETVRDAKGPLAPAIHRALDGFRTQVELVQEELEDLGLAGVGR